MQPVSPYSSPPPIEQPPISHPTPSPEQNISNLATEILLIENPPPSRAFLIGDPEQCMNELWKAAKLQRWGTVLELLKKHPFDVNVSPTRGENEGKTALWMACADEKWDVVTEMLKGHCNVNAGPTSGSYAGTTVLWIAIYNQQWPIVQEMLTRTDVDVNKVPTEFERAPGHSPLWLALVHKQWGIAFELLKHNCEDNEREDCFRLAISVPHWEIVKVMLKRFSCDVNKLVEGEEGWTPLYLAAYCKKWEIVQLMLDTCICNINSGPNDGEEKGQTVLFLAAAAKKENIVRKMLSIPGCDVNASFQGRTPLWFFKDKITDITTWLLLLGARIYKTKIEGVTPEEELEVQFLDIYQNHLNNILHSFTEVITDPYTANPFLKLPRDLLELFLCEILKCQFHLLREIPDVFLVNKCREIRGKTLHQKHERAITWFTKQAYGALKKRVSSEQLPRFHAFHANWNMVINKCIEERKLWVFNRKIRAHLIASIQYNSYPFDYRTMLETVVGVLSREPIVHPEEDKRISISIDKENGVNKELALAVSHQRWDVVPVLLTQPECNVNIPIGEKGMTPLLLAAANKKWDIVRLMLAKPCDLTVSPIDGINKGKTPLWLACINDQWDIVEKMLVFPCDLTVSPSEGRYKGATPLWIACREGQWDIVEKMLAFNCDLNASPADENLRGRTPLWIAVFKDQWDIVLKMLALPCDLNVAPPEATWSTPLFMTILKGEWEIVRLMLYLPCNLDIFAPDEEPFFRMTPLWYAAFKEQWEIVEEMLSLPCDVNVAPNQGPHKGKTPLWFCKSPIMWVTKLLLAKGATIKMEDLGLLSPEESRQLDCLIEYKRDFIKRAIDLVEIIARRRRRR